jgi:hypothetical protein
VSFRSFALPEFWKCYESLAEGVRALADAKFVLFEGYPFHPSMALKQKGEVWTADGWPLLPCHRAPGGQQLSLVLDRYSRGYNKLPNAAGHKEGARARRPTVMPDGIYARCPVASGMGSCASGTRLASGRSQRHNDMC